MIGRAICLGSCSYNMTSGAEHLRSQLDQLHSEVETTTRKGRLLRLSEAAENLRRQAAVSVQLGKENDARELLRQKNKVMLALHKSKGRVHLLDELAAKLNQAISIKEEQLVQNVASDFEFSGDHVGTPVHVVPPPQHTHESLDVDTHISKDPGFMFDIENEANVLDYNEDEDKDKDNTLVNISSENKATILSRFRGSSYIDFLEHLDTQLNKIEEDLVAFLELSTLVLENEEEKTNNSRMQQVLEILYDIRGTRLRIQNVMPKKMEIK